MTKQRQNRSATKPAPATPPVAAAPAPAPDPADVFALSPGDAAAMQEINGQLHEAKMQLANATTQRLNIEMQEREIGSNVMALNGEFQRRMEQAAANVGVNLKEGKWFFDLEAATFTRKTD